MSSPYYHLIIQNEMADSSQRQFVKMSTIPEHLICSICYSVFLNPLRLFCGHTYCSNCVDALISKGPADCPECRSSIRKADIGVDLIARQIINELQVFCPSEECQWKGQCQQLDDHLSECVFYDKKLKAKKKKKKENQPVFQMVDDEVNDKINENIVKGSLESRILTKADSLKGYLIKQDEKQESSTKGSQKGRKGEKKISKGKSQDKRFSGINFLEELFD